MATNVGIPLILIKTVAVSGIAFLWANFTVKAFQIAWHIISTSPEKEEILPMKEMVVCEQCQKHFLDDGNELEQNKFLCEACRVLFLKKNFINISSCLTTSS